VGLRRVVLNRAGDSAKKVEVLKLSKIDLQKFVGDYKIDEKFIGNYAIDEITNSVIINDGVPFLAVNKNTKCKMKFISKNEFFMTEDPGALYTFQIDSDGKVSGFTGNDGEKSVTLRRSK
jgi:hypothetical protein